MNNIKYKPTILVIVGVTGDLSRRKLLPSVINLIKVGLLPKDFKIIGTTRHEISKSELLKGIDCGDEIKNNINILSADINTEVGNNLLKSEIKEISKGKKYQIIFNLSIPPKATIGIIRGLAKAKFNLNSQVKLLLEKPFGEDLDSAKSLIKEINKHFKDKQIYRIDHYLAKEMSQNILIFRKNNSLFKETFNQKFVKSIEIIAKESIGIEGRVNFFEQTGTLRDLVQSHLLQLTALTLLDIDNSEKDIRKGRAIALSKLNIAKDKKGNLLAKRGQYESYKKEVNNKDSHVETFASLTLESSDKNWSHVPITLITGKSLDEKTTKIVINYKDTKEAKGNQLTLEIAPAAKIDLTIMSKIPGFERKSEENVLNFNYDNQHSVKDAYEQVLIDAIYSDPELFISDKEIIESWRIIDKLEKNWERDGKGLIIYKNNSQVKDIK